jgi:hypothetical protein
LRIARTGSGAQAPSWWRHRAGALATAAACYSSSSSSIRRSARHRAFGSAGSAHRQHGFELRSDGIRYRLQWFLGIALHSAALHVARWAID